MRLSISSFDLVPLAKAIGAGALLIAIVWAVMPDKLVSDEIPVGSVETFNELVLEQYLYQYKKKRVVLVGSSIQTYIPSFDCRPNDVATIYLQSRSGANGLAAIEKLGAKPEVIFLEATVLLPVDEELMSIVFRPLYWHIRMLVPPLRSTRNWVVLLSQKYVYARNLYVWRQRPAPMELDLPPQSIDEWNNERHIPQLLEAASKKKYEPATNDFDTFKRTVELVEMIRKRGIRVIMYEPSDPRFAKFSPMKERRAALRAALPDVEYIEAPDDKLPLYRWEGFHIHEASGVLLFNYLMERAGLPERALCKVRPKTVPQG